jgi:phage I-like protein
MPSGSAGLRDDNGLQEKTKGEIMKLRFFKTGKHTDASGTVYEYSDDTVAGMIDNYNNRLLENKDLAPVVLGHPQNDSPAMGWVDKLERVGDWIYATVRDASQKLVDAVKDNQYKYLSASIRSNNTLKHIGLVPVAAIKGTGIEFSETNQEITYVVEFNEETQMNPEVLAKIAELEKEIKLRDDKITAMTKQTAEFAEKNEILTAQSKMISDLQASLAQIKKDAETKEIANFCESMVAAGKMTPAERPIVEKMIANIGGAAEFSEGTKLIDAYKKTISDRPSILQQQPRHGEPVSFSEMDPNELHQMISARAKKDGVSHAEATDLIYGGK